MVWYWVVRRGVVQAIGLIIFFFSPAYFQSVVSFPLEKDVDPFSKLKTSAEPSLDCSSPFLSHLLRCRV